MSQVPPRLSFANDERLILIRPTKRLLGFPKKVSPPMTMTIAAISTFYVPRVKLAPSDSEINSLGRP